MSELRQTIEQTNEQPCGLCGRPVEKIIESAESYMCAVARVKYPEKGDATGIKKLYSFFCPRCCKARSAEVFIPDFKSDSAN